MVYALIVVENMTAKSAGDAKQRREDSGAVRSFSALCLFVFAVVAYLAAGDGALRYIAITDRKARRSRQSAVVHVAIAALAAWICGPVMLDTWCAEL
jgi:hypothetical protein